MSDPETDSNAWQAWDRFVETADDTGFMQSSLWAMFRASSGYEYFAVIVKEQDTIVGGALVAKWSYSPRSCFYYIQDGPLLPDDESLAHQVYATVLENVEAHRKAEAQTVSHLRIEPRWQRLPPFVCGFRPLAFDDPITEPRNTLCVDLRASDEQLLERMKSKGRYNIRVAAKHGVCVVEDSSAEGLSDFLRIQGRTAKRQGISGKPASYFRDLVSLFTPTCKIALYFAQYKGRRLAAALVVYFGRRATYFFGGSLVLHRNVMAPYLLHFEIMRRARDLGFHHYDFWGIAPADQSDHPWQNITAFKRKFGGHEIELVPTLDYVYNAAAYERYAGKKGRTRQREPECIHA